MLLPEYLRRIAEKSEYYAGILLGHIMTLMTKRITKRLERKEDYLFTATDRWQVHTLQEAGYLLEDIQKTVSEFTKVETAEVKRCMEEAGIKALEYDDDIYEKAGLSVKPLKESPAMVRLMQRNYEATNAEIRNFTRTTANAAQRKFIEECDKAYIKVTSNAQTINEAVREAVDNIIEDGGKVHYPSGHTDTVETAVARAVRTGVAQATGDIQLKRMEEMDWDIILTSAHVGARTGDGGENPGNHYWWQGRFFSRTGRDKRFPDFKTSTGYGTVTGLCGANCRHSFGPGDGKFNPFKKVDSEENKRVESINKQMRLMERNIRKRKQALMGIQAAIDASGDDKTRFAMQQKYDKLSAALKVQERDYIDYCKKNDTKTLDERLRTAKWGSKQARASEEAAKRYKDSYSMEDTKSVAKSDGSDIMKLPKYEDAVIPEEKFSMYALNPDKDPHKAKAFKDALGYDLSNYHNLITDIRNKLAECKAVEKPDNGHGRRYEVIMEISGPNGKSANVLTAWIDDKENGEMRMTTAHIDRRKKKNGNKDV